MHTRNNTRYDVYCTRYGGGVLAVLDVLLLADTLSFIFTNPPEDKKKKKKKIADT